MICEICNKEANGLKGLAIHLKKKHKISDVELKEYYDKYLKKVSDGKCYFCENETIFYGFSKGYHRICTSQKCLGKTRATATYEFLMYKYNLNENDAIKMMKERAEDRGKKIKESLDNRLVENHNFHKEKSHQTKEYWMKRGLNENKAKEKAKEVMNMIHVKSGKKRKENPKLYDDILPTQLKYWLKKGFKYKQAKEKLKERQTTFSLDICIKKYGKDKGKKVWIERQNKWHKNYKKSNFSKISQELYWRVYNLIENKSNIKFATLKNDKRDDSGSNNEYRLHFIDDSMILPDFINLNSKKIIEFDGVYYHRNTSENIKREKERDNKIYKNGYDVLHINENDYKQNPETVVKRCITFLKNDE